MFDTFSIQEFRGQGTETKFEMFKYNKNRLYYKNRLILFRQLRLILILKKLTTK